MHKEQTILVCVTGQKSCDKLIQAGVQLAREYQMPLLVIHVAAIGAPLLGGSTQSEALDYLYRLSSEAGAEMAVLRAHDPVERLIQYAREENAAHLVLGAGRPDGPDRRDMAGLLRVRLPHAQVHVVFF